jgi:hypothetical protein
MKEAEDLFKKEMAKSEPDLQGLAEKFYRIKVGAADPRIKSRASMGLVRVRNEMKKREQGKGTPQDVTANLKKEFKELEEKFKNIDREYNKRRAAKEAEYLKGRKKTAAAAKKPVTVGFIDRDWQLKSTTPFVLIKGGIIQMYLKSDRYDLGDYLKREVSLKGEMIRPEGYDFPIMLVKKIEILSN